MPGDFYTVFPDGRKRFTSLTAPQEEDFFASCLEVRMFNVEKGEIILLTMPDRRNVWLVDGGSGNKEIAPAEAIVDYLNDGLVLRGIVLSHPHKDHGGAIENVLRSPQLADTFTFYRSNDPFFDDPEIDWLDELGKQLEVSGVEPEIVSKGAPKHGVDFGSGVIANLFAGEPVTKGLTSIFLHLRFGAARLLFTGDVDCKYELALLDTASEAEFFRADVLKLTHHGNSDGTSKKLLCAVKPGIAIASTAGDSGHRLEQDTLARLGGRPGRRKVLETFVDGDIIIKTDGRSVNGGVLYHVDRKRPGLFAEELGATTSLLRDIVRDADLTAKCEEDC